MTPRVLVLPALLLSFGCMDRELGPIDPTVSRVIDQSVSAQGVVDVDLLLVIDDSNSMSQEQASLAREVPRLIRGLVDPPDEDGDGAPDWNAVESLEVAVVTTDLGTNGVPTRDYSRCGLVGPFADPWGGGGNLRTDATCGSGEAVQRFAAGDDPETFAASVGCLAVAGTSGCGFEQQLAAAGRAVAAGGSFPRPDSLLAVLVLTDEEDCSIADPATFYASAPTDRTANVYCAHNLDLLRPVEELVASLRAGREERFLFAALAGVPEDGPLDDLAALLADGRMEYVDDPTSSIGLRPACRSFEADGTTPRGDAAPSRRIVQAAQLIPGSLIRSICAYDYQPAVAELTRRIGARVTGACLGRSLSPAADGSVQCTVRETLAAGGRCAELTGRQIYRVEADGRETCDVSQAPGGVGSGWYYDLSDTECDRVSFTTDALPVVGSRVRFVCAVELETEVPGDPVGP